MDREAKHELIHKVFETRAYWSPLPFVVRRGREKLGKLFAELGFTSGAEIGVSRGDFSARLCLENPELRMHCVDAWQRYGGHTQENQDKRYEIAKKKLAPYGAKIIRESSFDALQHFTNGQLDFVYIDGGHNFDTVCLDLILWARKVKRGGIVALHDFHMTGDVAAAVEAYVRGHRVEMWFKTLEVHPTVFWVH